MNSREADDSDHDDDDEGGRAAEGVWLVLG